MLKNNTSDNTIQIDLVKPVSGKIVKIGAMVNYKRLDIIRPIKSKSHDGTKRPTCVKDIYACEH